MLRTSRARPPPHHHHHHHPHRAHSPPPIASSPISLELQPLLHVLPQLARVGAFPRAIEPVIDPLFPHQRTGDDHAHVHRRVLRRAPIHVVVSRQSSPHPIPSHHRPSRASVVPSTHPSIDLHPRPSPHPRVLLRPPPSSSRRIRTHRHERLIKSGIHPRRYAPPSRRVLASSSSSSSSSIVDPRAPASASASAPSGRRRHDRSRLVTGSLWVMIHRS